MGCGMNVVACCFERFGDVKCLRHFQFGGGAGLGSKGGRILARSRG